MSNIDPTKPIYGRPTTQSVRTNFQYSADEITVLQNWHTAVGNGPFLNLSGGTMTGALILNGPPVAANGAATKASVETYVASLPITVKSFNTRTGDVILNGPDITSAGGLLLSGGTMTGPLTLRSVTPVSPWEATPKNYVDTRPGALISDTAPASPINGTLWWDSVSTQLFVWYTDPSGSQWVNTTNAGSKLSGTGSGGVPEAPLNDLTYGRYDAAWVTVLPLSGGTMTGPVILQADPTNVLGAATKQYVDSKLLFGSIFTGTGMTAVSGAGTFSLFSSTGIGSRTILANSAKVGTRYRAKSMGYYNTPVAASNLTFAITFGGTQIITFTAAAPQSISSGYFEMISELTVRTIGASGTIVCSGYVIFATGVGAVQTFTFANTTGPITINTTVNSVFDMTASWSAPTSHSINSQQNYLETMGPAS